jgi:transcriptional regulator with XRE-family HTH domain
MFLRKSKMATTALGKALRRLRLERDMLLKSMADNMGVTSSYLSAIETGKKQPPSDFLSRIAKAANLNQTELNNIQTALDQSITECKMKFDPSTSNQDREAMAVLARTFGDMSEEHRQVLREAIFKGK